MNSIKRGEIYWISSGTNDNDYLSKTLEKCRPAIVVSNDFNNRHSNNLEVVFLTTSPKAELPTHCTIRTSKSISTALCEQICTIKTDQIGDYIGTTTDAEMAMVENCILISLGIDHLQPQLIEQLRQATENPDKDDSRKSSDSIDAIRKEAEMYKELYNNLLEKILAK